MLPPASIAAPVCAARRTLRMFGRVRVLVCMAGLALLSACAGQPKVDQVQEAARYEAHAARTYKVPGTPDDPWGPYVVEAAQRFDVPHRWIREVMRVESGGLQYHNGELTTSTVGAMGLMQVMPETYDGLRMRYGLNDDAYDPHNNILAGTAYIREMYDLYGAPGFLAAYNAGPGRLDDYLTRNRGLPDETRKYVAKIGPYIAGIYPERRSPSQDLAINQIPIDIPAGPRYARVKTNRAYAAANAHGAKPGRNRDEQVADRRRGRREDIEVAEAPPAPPASNFASPSRLVAARGLPIPTPEPRVQTAMAGARSSGFHLINPAAADSLPTKRGAQDSGGKWAIQVGAFGNESQARSAADSARGEARTARAEVGSVKQPHATLYRARVTGMSRDAAVQACERLSKGKGNCIVLSPASQS